MWKINVFSGIFLFILGFFIRKFKMTYLIAGYNTASKEQKKKYDKNKLVNYVGNFLMYSSGILFLGSFLSVALGSFSKEIILTSWILFTTYIIIWIFYVNLSGCLIKNN